jgi:hypothetical protein
MVNIIIAISINVVVAVVVIITTQIALKRMKNASD